MKLERKVRLCSAAAAVLIAAIALTGCGGSTLLHRIIRQGISE